MYVIYSLFLALLILVTLPYWLLQMGRHGKYRAGLRERMGNVPERLGLPSSGPTVWIHAVSVGEVLAISGLASEITPRFPHYRVLVSTTTDTGQKLARRLFGEQNVFYFPLDFGFAIRPYMQAIRPRLVVIAETELWPNFLRIGKAYGARIVVVNARVSEKSFRGYHKVQRWLSRVLLDVDLFLAQTEEDQARLTKLGVPRHKVEVAGNLKFDISPPPPPAIVATLQACFTASNGGPILVCGSTVEDEEPLLLRAFENILASHPRAVMILAPRHPERFSAVVAHLEKLGLRFWRRSLWSGEPLAGGVFLVDSIGELGALYSLATIAFVGGSLVPHGGHNIIEPAQYGVPIVVGTHTENFREIVRLFQSRNAIRVVGPAELPLVFMELLSHEAERKALGLRGRETLRSQTGATERTLSAFEKFLSSRTIPPPSAGTDAIARPIQSA